MQSVDGTGELEIERRIRARAQQMAWHPNYEAWVHGRVWQERNQEPVLKSLNRYVANWRTGTILDLGCGMGGLVVRLQKEGLRAFGLDYCLDYCVIAKLRGTRYGIHTQVMNARGEFIPIKDRTVDVVFCNELIEHVFDPVAVLKELRRLIRPGGTIFITVPNRFSLYDHHYHLWGINLIPRPIAECLLRFIGRYKGNDISAGFQKLSEMHYFSYPSFVTRCRRVGLEPRDIRWDKLMMGHADRLSPKLQQFVTLLARLGILYPIYLLWRSTVMDEWHFVLTPKG